MTATAGTAHVPQGMVAHGLPARAARAAGVPRVLVAAVAAVTLGLALGAGGAVLLPGGQGPAHRAGPGPSAPPAGAMVPASAVVPVPGAVAASAEPWACVAVWEINLGVCLSDPLPSQLPLL